MRCSSRTVCAQTYAVDLREDRRSLLLVLSCKKIGTQRRSSFLLALASVGEFEICLKWRDDRRTRAPTIEVNGGVISVEKLHVRKTACFFEFECFQKRGQR